jgi:hypothetical protein
MFILKVIKASSGSKGKTPKAGAKKGECGCHGPFSCSGNKTTCHKNMQLEIEKSQMCPPARLISLTALFKLLCV